MGNVPKVLVANNSELLRHLTAPPFRRLDLELIVASKGDEALEVVRNDRPVLALLDAEMSGVTGYDIARRIREEGYGAKVVLVLGKRLTADQMRKVADCGCDEVLIAPMSADELFDVVAIQLGMPRHGDIVGAARFRTGAGSPRRSPRGEAQRPPRRRRMASILRADLMMSFHRG